MAEIFRLINSNGQSNLKFVKFVLTLLTGKFRGTWIVVGLTIELLAGVEV